MTDKPVQVTINLMEIPPHGEKQVIMRIKMRDYEDMTKAHQMLGLTQAEFLRTLVIKASRKVLAEYS